MLKLGCLKQWVYWFKVELPVFPSEQDAL